MTYKYIPHTEEDIKTMLKEINAESIDCFFRDIPEEVKLNRDYNLPDSMSELDVVRRLQELRDLNTNNLVHFIGAGSYDHYIPSIIKHITSRSEYYTAYTPYQPEIAQGTLQYIFEYQTMICNLTGMDVSNASMYDGATSCAEAIMMATSITRRNKVLVSSTMHPHTIETIKTYGHYNGFDVVLLNHQDGLVTEDELVKQLNSEVACVVISNPNFFGLIENPETYVQKIHDNKSLLIMMVNPLSLGILKPPGEIGADIVCGEAQSLGIPLSFGGPYLGFLCTKKDYVRKMPGRICGQTTDVDGRRAFVLTLQAREQHIRREKANSNICSNQSLMALMTTVYLATMGKEGLKEVCLQNIQKAHYAYKKITALPNFEPVFTSPFFNEFVVKTNVDYEVIKEALLKENMMAGVHLGIYYEELKNHILFCVTEKRTKAEIDRLVQVLGGLK